MVDGSQFPAKVRHEACGRGYPVEEVGHEPVWFAFPRMDLEFAREDAQVVGDGSRNPRGLEVCPGERQHLLLVGFVGLLPPGQAGVFGAVCDVGQHGKLLPVDARRVKGAGAVPTSFVAEGPRAFRVLVDGTQVPIVVEPSCTTGSRGIAAVPADLGVVVAFEHEPGPVDRLGLVRCQGKNHTHPGTPFVPPSASGQSMDGNLGHDVQGYARHVRGPHGGAAGSDHRDVGDMPAAQDGWELIPADVNAALVTSPRLMARDELLARAAVAPLASGPTWGCRSVRAGLTLRRWSRVAPVSSVNIPRGFA